MRLVWSAFAITGRDEIYEYIESESPRNAAMVDKRIAESVELLLDFPESGRPGRVAGTRECVVPRSP
jgi:toxin ParE1/3/4